MSGERLWQRIVGELIELPGLIGDFVIDFGEWLNRLTIWLRRYDPDPDIRHYYREVRTNPPADTPTDPYRKRS